VDPLSERETAFLVFGGIGVLLAAAVGYFVGWSNPRVVEKRVEVPVERVVEKHVSVLAEAHSTREQLAEAQAEIDRLRKQLGERVVPQKIIEAQGRQIARLKKELAHVRPGLAARTVAPGTSGTSRLAYDIVDRKRYDAPIKTQVEVHAVVKGAITEAGLRAVLQDLYAQAGNETGFKHHGGKASHVFVYLYSSKAHFDSGWGQWIAMLSRLGAGSKVDAKVRNDLVSQLYAKPKTVFGLSEAKRREIFRALWIAEGLAMKRAERAHPITSALSPDYRRANVSEQVMKQAEAVNSATAKAREEVANRFGITLDQLRKITVEGVTKNWPTP